MSTADFIAIALGGKGVGLADVSFSIESVNQTISVLPFSVFP